MNVTHRPSTMRLGLVLAAIAALVLFVARSAAAQAPATQRLSLGDAVRLAARQSAAVQGANLRVDQARARVEQSRSALLPNLSALALESGHTLNSATFGFNFPAAPGQKPLLDPNGQIIGPVKTLDVRARASETLFDLSAIRQVQAASVGADAAQSSASSVAELAASQAAVAYLAALRADATLQARLADSSLAVDLLNIARDQVAAGVGVALDVTRAEAQLAGVKAQLISARNGSQRARLDLLRALNLPLDTPLELADSLAAPPAGAEAIDPAGAVAQALSSRPDVKAAEQQLRAARVQLTATRSERLPSVSVFGDDGAIGLNLNHMLATWDWGIQLSVPVFDGLRRENRIREQEAASRELEVRERDLRQQVSAEVRAALLDLSSARQAVDAARERERLAEQEVSQARERFSAGVAGNADVITASLTLNDARTQVIDALTSYQAARVALARAEGRAATLE